jgi:hypothetical protein
LSRSQRALHPPELDLGPRLNSEALSRKFDLGQDEDVTRSPFAREFLRTMAHRGWYDLRRDSQQAKPAAS